MSDVEIARVAERALLVRFHDVELEIAVAKAQALGFEANHARLSEIEKGESDSEKQRSERLSLKGKTVLGAGSLLVELPSGSGAADLESVKARIGALAAEVDRRAWIGAPAQPAAAREHGISVRFGGEAGPDLESVARECGIATEAVVERLCSAELRVAFVGFAPGFPYLIGLPAELELPRLASPRPRVPAGSVAIAGPFAGVYPSETPGGWRLLGRLAVAEPPLFDPFRDPPARLAPSDRVRFMAQSIDG